MGHNKNDWNVNYYLFYFIINYGQNILDINFLFLFFFNTNIKGRK